jgi:hypothetical protein
MTGRGGPPAAPTRRAGRPWREGPGCPGALERRSDLMQDLVLAEDDRVVAHRDRHEMAARRRPVHHSPAGRDSGDGRRQSLMVAASRIGLDPMARLDDHAACTKLLAERRCESPTLEGRNVARMGHEGDDGSPSGAAHARRTGGSAGIREAGSPRRAVARLCPVMVAMSNWSMARSAATRRSVDCAASNPLRRLATASS